MNAAKKLALALTLTAATSAALADDASAPCSTRKPFGLKGVNVGQSLADAPISALLTSPMIAECSDAAKNPGDTCITGSGTVAEQPVKLVVRARDGLIVSIGGIFEPDSYAPIILAFNAKYCGGGTDYRNQEWFGAWGDRIAASLRSAVFTIRSKAEYDRDQALLLKAEGDI